MESTFASVFPEHKGPRSTEKRHSEGWQSVGKDEVGGSNPPSSSMKARNYKVTGFLLHFLVSSLKISQYCVSFVIA